MTDNITRAGASCDLARWSRADDAAIAVLVALAAMTRFWHLGFPRVPVFDEIYYVGYAATYLRGEQLINPHPPLMTELMAASLWLFGASHPWSWRLPNAAIGTALVGVTYLLGRRTLQSRQAAALAAAFVIFDGAFLVNSRIALLEIAYATLAALSYLLLFRFIQRPDTREGGPTLLALGITLGLCLGSKLFVPVIAFLLAMGFLAYALAARSPASSRISTRMRLIVGALLLVASAAALAFAAVFLPNYLFLGWGGAHALWQYFRDAYWLQQGISAFEQVNYWRDQRACPWWSWPLLLHPFVYWQDTSSGGAVSTIWFGGNPILWWGASGAILITCVRLWSVRNLANAFLAIGYFGYLLAFVPISRTTYIYHYLPALYLAYLALAMVLRDCWRGEARRWEQAILLVPLAVAARFALGDAGLYAIVALAGASGMLLWRFRDTGKLVCAAFLSASLAASVYFVPIWVGLPLSPAAFKARMWLVQPGLCNWSQKTKQ